MTSYPDIINPLITTVVSEAILNLGNFMDHVRSHTKITQDKFRRIEMHFCSFFSSSRITCMIANLSTYASPSFVRL